jgi:hypothetical protein
VEEHIILISSRGLISYMHFALIMGYIMNN